MNPFRNSNRNYNQKRMGFQNNAWTLTMMCIAMMVMMMFPAPSDSFLLGTRKITTYPTTQCSATSSSSSSSLDQEKKEEVPLEVLWDMAGRTAKKKRKRGKTVGVMRVREDYSGKVEGYTPPTTRTKNERPPLSEDEIASVDVYSSNVVINDDDDDDDDDTATTPTTTVLANVTLVNGTKLLAIDPRALHQRQDNSVWMALRAALDVTASEFSAVLGTSFFTSRQTLLDTKSGKEKKVFAGNSKACEWGLRMEPRALAQYQQVTRNTVEETGLHVRKHDFGLLGASPDGLVVDQQDGSKGLLEIKCLWGRRNKKELPQYDYCPNRFYDQIQGQLAVCDREWCDLMMFIPPSGYKNRKNYCILRIERNNTHWSQKLLPALEEFCDELNQEKAGMLLKQEKESAAAAAA